MTTRKKLDQITVGETEEDHKLTVHSLILKTVSGKGKEIFVSGGLVDSIVERFPKGRFGISDYPVIWRPSISHLDLESNEEFVIESVRYFGLAGINMGLANLVRDVPFETYIEYGRPETLTAKISERLTYKI